MEEQIPTTKLYSPSAVTLSTVIGMPVAGTILLARNYRALGNPGAARHCLVWGVTATLILIALGFFLNIPRMILPITYTIAMHNLATTLQGRSYRRHLERGGQKTSLWAAAGIGFLCVFALLGVFYVIEFLFPE